MSRLDRRRFLQGLGASAALVGSARALRPSSAAPAESALRFGLVTYLWGQDWELPTLLQNCEKAGLLGVELRSTHRHGVEPTLDDAQRAAVKARFADSPVELVGLGSDERFDSPDPAVLKKAQEATRAFLKLSHDVGGSGVKVKPDRFHEGVEKERTLEQIGRSLRELAPYADELGQELRVEVHGQCSPLPHMKRIAEVADHPRVRLCWNSNPQDLEGAGLAENFAMVRPYFGATAHVRELDQGHYPYEQLLRLMVDSEYRAWVLLEARGKPEDRVQAMIQQRRHFEGFVKKALDTDR